MAANPMIDKQDDTQTRSNGIKKIAHSTPAPHASPSVRQFQDATKRIVSTSARRSSPGMHSNAPTLPSSESRPSYSGKARRYSFSNVVACVSDDRNRSTSRYTARLSNTGQDCQSSLSGHVADDMNRRTSHHGASNRMTSHGDSHHIASDNMLKYGPSLPSSSRCSHPNTSSSNHAFSHPSSSSDIVNHGSSHSRSFKNASMCHASPQPATLQGDDADVKDWQSGLSNEVCSGNEQTHPGGYMTEPSFSNPRVCSMSQSGSKEELASRNLATAPRKSSKSRAATPKAIARAAESHKKGPAEIRDSASKHTTNELCKDCKANIRMMESVCFIANDGRISAALTGASYTRHSHHCNVKGCLGNQNYRPSPSSSSKKNSLSKSQAPVNLKPTRKKSHTLPGTGDHRGMISSVQGDNGGNQETESSMMASVEVPSSVRSDASDMKEELKLQETSMNCSEGDKSHVNTDSPCHSPIDQSELHVVSPCKDHSPSPSAQASTDQQSSIEISHVENVEVRSTPAASCVSSDMHDNDDNDDDEEKGFLRRDEIEALNDFKSVLYHGDNEYSCSEDGTEATTTPNSLIKGAFDDLSNMDIEGANCKNELSGSKWSRVARMRQKYLESLREQEAETIRLRKQEIMARKQAGDWMLDCHMEEVVHRLAPNGEARVKVLVEAFETVMNQSDSEGSQTAHHHHDPEHAKNLHGYASS